MPTITELDESAAATRQSYSFTRVVRIDGRYTVRARVKCDTYDRQSHAVAEVLADNLTWTQLADDAPSNWWSSVPSPAAPGIHAATALGGLADQLIHRAAEILPPVQS